MKKQIYKASWVVVAALIVWSIVLLLLISPSLFPTNDSVFILLTLLSGVAVILTIGSAIILLLGLGINNPRIKDYTHTPAAKILTLLLVTCLIISTATAIRSLWFNPGAPDFADKFVYENIATGTGFAAIFLTFVVSSMQRDIYWFNRSKRAIALDERQLRERQQVLELSYKIITFLSLITVIWIMNVIHNVPVLYEKTNGHGPGHIAWIGVNFVVTVAAMPLIIAALRRSK
jgi:hypothetical protein